MRWIKVSDRLPPYGNDKGEVKVITLDGNEAVRAYEMVSSVTDMLWQEVLLTPTEQELHAAGCRLKVEVSNNGNEWGTAKLIYIESGQSFVVIKEDGLVDRFQFCRMIRKKPEDFKVGLVLNSHSGDYIDMSGMELPSEAKVRFVHKSPRPSIFRGSVWGESQDEMLIRIARAYAKEAAKEAVKIFEDGMKRHRESKFWDDEWDGGAKCDNAQTWLKAKGFQWNPECFAWTRGHYDQLHEARLQLIKNLWIMTYGDNAVPIHSTRDADYELDCADKIWVGANSQVAKEWLEAKGFAFSEVLSGYKCDANNIRFMWRSEGWICYIGSGDKRPVADSDCADTFLLMASDPF